VLAGCAGTSNNPTPSDPGAAIPAPPSSPAATAGNAAVTLTWTASSTSTAYNVKRATTSGGPYTQIGAPTSTSYTDASLTNGTTDPRPKWDARLSTSHGGCDTKLRY